MKLTDETLKGLSWTTIGAIIQYTLNIVVLMILSRLLEPSDFGVVTAALVIIGVSEIFYKLGVGPSIVQRLTITEDHIRTAFTFTLFLSLIFFVLLNIFSSLIESIYNIPNISIIIRVMSFVFLFNGVSVVAESLLERNLNFKLISFVSVISYFLGYGIIGIFLALIGFGVWSLVAAFCTSAIVKSCIVLFKQPHSKKIMFSLKHFKELIRFGGGYTLNRLVNYGALQSDNFIAGKMLGAETLGYYSRAYTLMSLPATLFEKSVSKVLFPILSKVQKDKERLSRAYLKATHLSSMLLFPVSSVLFVLGPDIILFFLGSQWLHAVYIFQIMSISVYFRSAYKIGATLVRAEGSVYKMLVLQFIYFALIIISSIIGAYYHDVIGIAIGTSVTVLIHYLLTSILTIRITQSSPIDFIKAHIRGIVLSVVLLLILWPLVYLLKKIELSPFNILAISSVFLVLFLIVLIRFEERIIGKEMYMLYKNVEEKVKRLFRYQNSLRNG